MTQVVSPSSGLQRARVWTSGILGAGVDDKGGAAMNGQDYLLDNRATEAGGRFAALAGIFDRVTRARVSALGIASGWSCWEVGAGGPAIPSWLADQVGVNGHVLATDIDVSWMESDTAGGFEVRRHDVAADEPPAERFDLVHARLVLSHVPARERALEHMVSTLKPGGWLLVEDFDITTQPRACLDERTPAGALANRIRAAFVELLVGRGVDSAFGRTLVGRLRGLGLEGVEADAYFPVAREEARALELANVQQVRELAIERGLATDAEIERHLASVRAGEVDIATPPLVSAWGRVPIEAAQAATRGSTPRRSS